MIGILDSGIGGLASYNVIRRVLPHEPLVYLADRKNAPYGKRSEGELIRLVSDGIGELSALGADHVLLACCTASTVHHALPEELRRIAIPIIEPAARRAVALGDRITVISTTHTARSHAFAAAVNAIRKGCTVTELDAQPLVGMVESGARDGNLGILESTYLDTVASEILEHMPDVLILGCTHFSHLEGELCARLRGVRIVSPAREGALMLADRLGKPCTNSKKIATDTYTEAPKRN